MAFAQHMGTRGFTQRDVAREIMRGYGKLESRNIIENMKRDNKLSWIKEAGLVSIFAILTSQLRNKPKKDGTKLVVSGIHYTRQNC